MKVMILKTDNHTGVREGEIYEAKLYWLDPKSKVTLMDKNGNPKCNEYLENIKVIK